MRGNDDIQGDGGDHDDLDRRPSPGRGLRAFDTALTVAYVLLAVGTILALPLTYLAFTERGTFTVDAEVEPPYEVTFADGSAIESSGGPAAWIDFPEVPEQRYLDDDPTVLARVKLDREDLDSRVVAVAGLGAWFGLTWIGLINARRIVRAARSGQAFDTGNVRRLRWIAAAVLTFPLVTWAIRRGLDSTLDVVPPVHVRRIGPSWWVHLLAGLGLLALAEVFREGSRLRALDEATI
jgi:hypothetical protein